MYNNIFVDVPFLRGSDSEVKIAFIIARKEIVW